MYISHDSCMQKLPVNLKTEPKTKQLLHSGVVIYCVLYLFIGLLKGLLGQNYWLLSVKVKANPGFILSLKLVLSAWHFASLYLCYCSAVS